MTKNNDKIWTSSQPNKLYIIRKVLIIVIKMCFYWTVSKVMGIFYRILAYDAHSPNMIMSPDPRCKFLKFLFCANFIFNVRKIHKISSGKSSLLQKLSAKRLTGDGKHPFPPSGYRVKNLEGWNSKLCAIFTLEFLQTKTFPSLKFKVL